MLSIVLIYSTDMVKGSAIFGPKIGKFFQNLRNYNPVTVDLWLEYLAD